MKGPGGTLFVKRSQALARSDFVAAPLAWKEQQQQVWVSSEISSGNWGLDHWAVVLQVGLTAFARKSCGRRPPAIDPAALRDPSNSEEIERVLAGAPVCDWSVNVHEHAAEVVAYIQRELACRFPRAARRLRSSFLTEGTMLLHRALSAARASLRQRSWALRCTRLRCVLMVWRAAQTPVTLQDMLQGGWLSDLHCHIAIDVHRVGGLGGLLRTSCKRDRARHVSQLPDKLRDAPAATVNDAVQKLLRPRRLRRTGPEQLPRLRQADGTLCCNPDEVAARWREYFSEIEAGVEKAPECLAEECLALQQARSVLEELPGGQFPVFRDLENAFRGVSGRKL